MHSLNTTCIRTGCSTRCSTLRRHASQSYAHKLFIWTDTAEGWSAARWHIQDVANITVGVMIAQPGCAIEASKCFDNYASAATTENDSATTTCDNISVTHSDTLWCRHMDVCTNHTGVCEEKHNPFKQALARKTVRQPLIWHFPRQDSRASSHLEESFFHRHR